jgi:hypothetical protein
MPDVRITIAGLRETLDALQKTQADLVQAAAKPAAEAVLAIAKPYPSPSRARQPFKSDKSRRFFFAALRSGAISVPYRRTNAMGNAWDWQPTPDGAVATNPHPHAAMTIVKDTRFRYHRNWPTEEQIAANAAEPARAAAEAGIIRLVGMIR